MPIELLPFRYFDPLRKRWVQARYKARREVIAQTYERWEITGPPEIRADATPSSLTAGHLASSPSAAESIPIDLLVGGVLEPGGREEG
jgi:hypothetical protein